MQAFARRLLRLAQVQRQVWIRSGIYLFGGIASGMLVVLALPGGEHAGYLVVPCITAIVALAANLYRQIAGAKLLARRNHLLAEELCSERSAVEQANLRLVEATVELSHRATRDPLTGLANRALLLEHLISTLARRRPLGRSLSVIYLDLDRFKLINDTLGHAAGDELLRQIGPRIGEKLRESDVLARLGGDEFVVLSVDGDAEAAELVAERIRLAFAEPFRIEGRAVQVTPSLGVTHDDGQSTGPELVEQADAALYRAKELGRNRVQTFDSSLRSSVRARVRDDHVVGRLFGGETGVTTRFQHVLELTSGALVGVEVLIGLDEPDAEPLSGEALRDLAQRTGMSSLLDEELLRQAGRFLIGLGPHRDPGFEVLARLARPDVEFEDLAGFLAAEQLTEVLDGLSLAVAEWQIVSDLPTAAARIQAVRDLGVRVLLDDFGSGVASLSLLARLPLDGLRLHPDLVRAAEDEHGPQGEREAALATLAGAIEVARHRGLRIGARGVNTGAQLALLGRAGVELVQGDVVPVARSVSPAPHVT